MMAEPIDAGLAGHVLAQALSGDAFYQAISADWSVTGLSRLQLLARYFEYSILEGAQLGASIVPQPDVYGAAIWAFPQQPGLQQAIDLKKREFLRSLLGPAGFENHQSISDFMHSQLGQSVPPSAWYLSILGVLPERQSQGLGQRLLTQTLQQADRAGVSCFVETFSARNIRFYNRAGFIEAARHFEPVTAATYAVLVRDPRPA